MTIRVVLATALLAASVSVAIAQPAPGPRGGPGMGMNATGMPAGHPMMGGGMMPGCGAMGGDHVEGHIAFLKTEIGITEAQSSQWDAFANALRAQAKARHAAMADCASAAQAQSAPARTEAMITHMTARLESMKTILAAEKPLYAALSDQQKKTADELLAHPGMGMGMGRGMGMGMGMMGGRP